MHNEDCVICSFEACEFKVSRAHVRLGYCFTQYRRPWLYNGAPLVAFYDTLGIRRTYSRLKPPASSRGSRAHVKGTQIWLQLQARIQKKKSKGRSGTPTLKSAKNKEGKGVAAFEVK